MGKPENKVETRFRDGIKALGGRAYKFVSPGCSGVPDRVVCLPDGRVIFVELKSPKGVMSKLQIRRKAELMQMNQSVFVLSTTEQVDNLLKKIRGELYCGIHTP